MQPAVAHLLGPLAASVPAQPIYNSCKVPNAQDTEENRLVYMTLFKQYQVAVESLILQRLKEAVPGFSMDAFLEVRSLLCIVGTTPCGSKVILCCVLQ